MSKRTKTLLAWVATVIGAAMIIISIFGMVSAVMDSVNP